MGKSEPQGLPVAGLIDVGPVEPKQLAEIVHADDEEAIGVDRLPGTDHVVPPAFAVGSLGVDAGDVVRRIERMADENRVGLRGVERP